MPKRGSPTAVKSLTGHRIFYEREPCIGSCSGPLPMGREGERGVEKECMKCVGSDLFDYKLYKFAHLVKLPQLSMHVLFVSITWEGILLGWGDGSVGNVLVLQEQGCEFNPHNSTCSKKPSVLCMLIIPVLGRQRQEDPWGSLTNLPS